VTELLTGSARRVRFALMRLAAALLWLSALVVFLACGEEQRACYAGDYRSCRCANGAAGYQQCDVAFDGYFACVCDGRTPGVDGGPDAQVEAAVADSGDAGTARLDGGEGGADADASADADVEGGG
jgi:hypothetical protein